MKNVSEKIDTLRTATAQSVITASPEAIIRLKNNDVPKKDILAISRASAVIAAKRTPELLPYCHPLPIDCVDVEYDISENSITVTATVTAIWKTGVEMEALMAASAATLNIYDMLKPIDKDMIITATKLIEKTGGKTDYREKLPQNFTAAVIVTSDGTFAGKREDKSGKIIAERLKHLGINNIKYIILPDEKDQIRNELLHLCEIGTRLIVTTGGTGLSPRDVTVDAAKEVIEREIPAVSNAMQTYGQRRTPYAMLSRGVAGVRKDTVIITLPGSSRGTEECLNAVFPGLLHIYKMMAGGGH